MLDIFKIYITIHTCKFRTSHNVVLQLLTTQKFVNPPRYYYSVQEIKKCKAVVAAMTTFIPHFTVSKLKTVGDKKICTTDK
jgi:hypothetical protein